MSKYSYLKNLDVPAGRIDAVLDTDTYNEVDDQFALVYMFKSKDRINLKAVYAAPFYNDKSDSPEDGMRKSYDEIIKILDMTGNEEHKKYTFHGAENYMKNENEPVYSEAVYDLIARAKEYSPQNPLYVVCIGAITNVASAIAAEPDIAENIVIVWLGGNDINNNNACREFNMMQDIAAARVVFKSEAPMVQLPCGGVVSGFSISESEFNYWLKGKNAVCDFLVDNVMKAQKWAEGKPWTRIIWDVVVVAWLINDDDRFMESQIRPARLPEYDMRYAYDADAKLIRYINYVKRDALFEDLINKLTM